MKPALYLAMAVFVPVMSLAQNQYSFDEEVNAELDKMYQSSQAKSVQAQTVSAAPNVQVNVNPVQETKVEATQEAPAQQQSSPVVATVAPQTTTTTPQTTVAPVNQAAETAIQKQPTTIIEAAPLKESKAEILRKSRVDAEVATEQKIVEKLEQSRLEDEKRRSEALLGNKLDVNQNQQNTDVVVETKVIAPVQAVAPVVEKQESILDKDAIKNEVRASIAEMKETDKKVEHKTYVGALLGMGEYPDVNNLRGNYSLGFSVGRNTSEHALVEGSFLYSNFDVEQRFGGISDPFTGTTYPRITEMNQYQTALAMKYSFLEGSVKPVIGGLLAYTYRTYSDKQFGSSSNNAQSHALDAGLTGGVDVAVSESFTVGLDVRYMFNITNRSQNSGLQTSFSQSLYGTDTPVEELQHMNISLVGRASF